MNRISFDIQASEFGDVVVPQIDGLSLISILRDVELPFAKKEGSPSIAGGYDGIPKNLALFPSRHLLGEPNDLYLYRDGKVAVLECECGCPGCWSFVIKIQLNENKVQWGEFEQIHRQQWKYDSLGIFTFDRKQYEAALNPPKN